MSRTRTDLVKLSTLVCALACLPFASVRAETVIEEIVVTAQKREQALQDVPLSVQALSGDLIKSVSMRDFTEVVTLVPGASETFAVTATQKAFQIRGVFSGDGDEERRDHLRSQDPVGTRTGLPDPT